MNDIYQVCIPHTNRDCFDYETLDLTPCIGGRVWVPFRNQARVGIVINKVCGQQTGHSLKKITSIIDDKPLVPEDLLELCLWVGSYYQSPLSEVIPLVIPKKYRLGLPCSLPTEDFYQLNIPVEKAKTLISKKAKKQHELIDFLSRHQKGISKQTLKQHGYNGTQIAALLACQAINLSQQVTLPTKIPEKLSPPLTLNPEQAVAVASILEHIHHYQCFLLQGVTGSGKTEVYLHVIAKILEQGKQVLVLVPEIGLTPQLLSRFTARFNHPITVLHSNLNESERQIAWQLAKENKVKMVIGTRSAVFTPLPNLGLIIIDEEHDSSLKQMEGVRYSARDTALMRAHLANIPIILGTATPSLETIHNCKQKKYTLLRLTHKAASTMPLHYQLIDLRSQMVQHGLALPTLKIIENHLLQQNQVLVFINRRGFAPILLCHQCGWMVDCKACDSHLTLHKQAGQMICHHCGLTQRIPLFCNNCQSKELIPVGSGTQRIYEFLSHQFPDTNVLRIDRDEVRKKNSLNSHLDKINKGEAQLIIGTQMLAKGHHFPRLSLVVVVDADAGFYNQDFRAIEYLGQLLTQVSGRAGRAEHPGQVLIQTYLPDHPLLNLLIQHGYDEFANALLISRQEAQMPPFQFLAVIRAQGKTVNKVAQFLKATKDQIQAHPLKVLGPAPAPLPRKANQHRMQLLIKSPSRKVLKSSLTQLREWLTMNKLSNGIRWNVDVDPMDLS
ncbi:TPA: primosomal protein N' [Legionella pneumophila]|uniref:primosomal protein N' n=1 Tax=Legionella TaxID=445 RepID=UPI0007784E3E|nr:MULTISPECIES: primosomal protein N' [Legionella]HAT8859123.1 primosomal protein N' [Legionella pneumophila subsp. pneumophila]MCW8396522.1 primosomal protein N' [Legionella sp. PATHC039]HAT8580428.1 primosomal protein N' [Legionella pneumophila]HAT8641287.1 primosomal protein N' [Legionella pneumophila]HAT9650483.1 primosomal protein N' [Legionella pneumophila subsp. pneumophila]